MTYASSSFSGQPSTSPIPNRVPLVHGDVTNRANACRHLEFYLTHFLKRLQIFVRPGADTIECLLDVLDRVGHAEAQIALAEVAEGSTRQRGDAGVIEQRVGESFRWPPGLLDVG